MLAHRWLSQRVALQAHTPRSLTVILECLVLNPRAACRYALFYDAAPSALKFWTPFVSIFAFLAVALIEFRVAYGFITGN
jgi:hypothetical protein